MVGVFNMFEEELLKRVKYDQETGFFYWTNRPTKRADALLPNGYLMVRISVSNMRKGFMAHRVAWFSHHGRWPLGEIDHINKDKADNRIINLRECTRGQNVVAQWDRKRSLPRGVTNASHTNKVNPYMAQCGNIYLGYYKTPEEAHEIYTAYKKTRYGKEF
jgi:hypothetical protein